MKGGIKAVWRKKCKDGRGTHRADGVERGEKGIGKVKGGSGAEKDRTGR